MNNNGNIKATKLLIVDRRISFTLVSK